MNSFNHYSFGSVTEWFYRVILGINFDEAQPGYKHFFIKPQPGGTITSAQGTYHSISGAISSSWQLAGNGVYTLNVIVPGNTTAEISIPKNKTVTDWVIRESGTLCWSSNTYVSGVAGLTAGTADSNFVTFSAGSGSYCFQAGSSNLVQVLRPLPGGVSLTGITCDPLSGRTIIRYTVTGNCGQDVSIRVIDMAGRTVAEPVRARLLPGSYTTVWQGTAAGGSRLSGGTYLLKMQAGTSRVTTKKIMMIGR
jgi:hypothetical protein